MKKLLVLFVAVAATITLSAKTLYMFNRTQFQWSSNPAAFAALVAGNEDYDVQLTAPFVYKGTVALKSDWAIEPVQGLLSMGARQKANCLISEKATLPAVMTLCQPCIDCYPCDVLDIADHSGDGLPQEGPIAEGKANVPYTGIADANQLFGEPGWITVWNLYLVSEVNKKLKYVEVAKINLLDADIKSVFFTGAKGKNIYVKSANEGRNFQLQLTGAKNDYKFKYYERYLKKDGTWGNAGNVKDATAYIKSAKALNGTIYFNNSFEDTFTGVTTDDVVEILDVAGTVKLTRDASLTGKAVKGAFGAETAKVAKNWDDCTITLDAETCEQYFYQVFEDEYFGSAYKKYDVEIVEETPVDFFADYYDYEEEEEEEPLEP